MNAQRLYKQDGTETPIWFCDKCGKLYGAPQLWEVGTGEERAEECCRPRLCQCGAEVERGRHLCAECHQQAEHARELERFDKAVKIPWNEYIGPVCDGDRYFDDLDEARDYYDANGGCPDWLEACDERLLYLTIDSGDLLEQELEDQLPEDWDAGDCDGFAEFDIAIQAAVKAFNDAQKRPVYYSDRTRLVLLDESFRDSCGRD